MAWPARCLRAPLLYLLLTLLVPGLLWAQGFGAQPSPGFRPGGSDTQLQINSSGTFGAYAGTSCTNQFPRSLNASGTATCASVASTDLASTTGTGASIVLSTSPTFTTAITTPLVLGGSSTTATLDLQSTSGAGGTSDQVRLLGGTNGATVIARFWGTGRIGIGVATDPATGHVEINHPGLTRTNLYAQKFITGDINGQTSKSALQANIYHQGTNVATALTSVASAVQASMEYGYQGTAVTGGAGALNLRTVVSGMADDDAEPYTHFGALRVDIGTGYTQTTGPAGRFWFTDWNLHGPIAVQPALLSGITMKANNYYNGAPSAAPAYALALVSGPGGGGADATHNAATTYPLQYALQILGQTTGGTQRAFDVGLGCGGTGSGWHAAFASSIIGECLHLQQYDTYGIHMAARLGTGQAMYIESTAGNVGIGLAPTAAARLFVYAQESGYSQAILGQFQSNTSTVIGTGITAVNAGAHATGTRATGYAVSGSTTHAGAGSTSVQAAFFASGTHAGAGTTSILADYVAGALTCAGGTCTLVAGVYIEDQNAGTTPYGVYSAHDGNHLLAGNLQIGSTTQLTLTQGALGLARIAASGSAPGASGGKIELVCGTNAGTARLQAYAGTSTTPVTIADNIGGGLSGC